MLFKKENENQRKAYKKHQMGKYTKRSEGGHGHVGVGPGYWDDADSAEAPHRWPSCLANGIWKTGLVWISITSKVSLEIPKFDEVFTVSPLLPSLIQKKHP